MSRSWYLSKLISVLYIELTTPVISNIFQLLAYYFTCRLSPAISYILVENVKGFEDSTTRDVFIETLQKCDYIYQEFLLTPLQFSIPNSRLRYYCIAKHKSKGGNFSFVPQPEV